MSVSPLALYPELPMAIDPTANGALSSAHVSLHEAGHIAWNRGSGAAGPSGGFKVPSGETLSVATARPASIRSGSRGAASQELTTPHTAIQSASSGPADPNRWDSMLNRLGNKYNVPPLFLKAVMLIESGGRPDAVGDGGASVGLFQLHERGYGHGMGDSRYDPEINAERATKGLAEAWHAGERAGYTGEHAVRSAYDYSFNPGGGFKYQGDALVRTYNRLLVEQGLPPLT